MQLLEHYYIIAISAFSNKLGDALFLLFSVLWNFLIWEIRTYHSSNIAKKSEAERLLEKITQTYWFCTKYRVHVSTQLVPSGFIMGNGYYLAYIDIKQNDSTSSQRNSSGTHNNQTFTIHLYGWWSIQAMLTKDIITRLDPGNYKIILSSRDYNQSYIKTMDYFNNDVFHKNCQKGCNLILTDYEKKEGGGGVYFLSGSPGLGKTTTGRLLANKLNAWLCLDFEEFIHYDNSLVYSFEALYNYIQPDAFSPLVIVLDEVEDFLFRNIEHVDEYGNEMDKNEKQKKGHIFKNRNTKKNWSRLLDTVQQKKHVLLLLTTNKKKEFFDEIDTALLREYRVSQCYQYKKSGVKITL